MCKCVCVMCVCERESCVVWVCSVCVCVWVCSVVRCGVYV